MSLKVKLISCISLFMLMIGILIVGVFAANLQTINLQGNVQFDVADKTLYVKDIRIQTETAGSVETIPNFMPGYVNQSFDLNLGTVSSSSGTVNLYFDFINTSSIAYSASATGGHGIVLSTSGTIDGDEVPVEYIPTFNDVSGTIILTIQFNGSMAASLDGIVIMLEEINIPAGAALYVPSVSSSGATTDTYNGLAGGVAIDGSLDLSGIEFAVGETTLTISMTSLSDKYVKSIVGYDAGEVDYNSTSTDGTLFVNSTSLYLPLNESGNLSSGESKVLKIYIENNTGVPTTISGLKVSFEEKESLLQADIEGEYWYVEMGTVMRQTYNEYIRWRYIASVDDSSGYDSATKASTFDESQIPTGKGYFLLETDVIEKVPFCNEYINESGTYHHQENGWTNIRPNDYATSNIRQYINGNPVHKVTFETDYSLWEPTGEVSSMFIDYYIDPENDIIYTQIIGRSLGDLYRNNKGSTSGGSVSFPSFLSDATITYTQSDLDKFWLLSYNEAYSLLAGNIARRWGGTYWLRSPGSSQSTVWHIQDDGTFYGTHMASVCSHASRAAFKMEI